MKRDIKSEAPKTPRSENETPKVSMGLETESEYSLPQPTAGSTRADGERHKLSQWCPGQIEPPTPAENILMLSMHARQIMKIIQQRQYHLIWHILRHASLLLDIIE